RKLRKGLLGFQNGECLGEFIRPQLTTPTLINHAARTPTNHAARKGWWMSVGYGGRGGKKMEIFQSNLHAGHSQGTIRGECAMKSNLPMTHWQISERLTRATGLRCEQHWRLIYDTNQLR